MKKPEEMSIEEMGAEDLCEWIERARMRNEREATRVLYWICDWMLNSPKGWDHSPKGSYFRGSFNFSEEGLVGYIMALRNESTGFHVMEAVADWLYCTPSGETIARHRGNRIVDAKPHRDMADGRKPRYRILLIRPREGTWTPGEGEPAQFLVRAESRKLARKIAHFYSAESPKDKREEWLDTELTDCEEIAPHHKRTGLIARYIPGRGLEVDV